MPGSPSKKTVWIVEQSAWRSSEGAQPPMPLTGGYLKAVTLADAVLRNEFEVRVFSFAGHESIPELARALFHDTLPDVFAFSVLGWNIKTAERLASVYRQLRPQGWVVWGGNHVSGQGDRLLRNIPDVDVIVNGEGEITWACLLKEILAGARPTALFGVDGLSFRAEDGQVVTTQDRPRITNLDDIPSPFLTGALPVADERGGPLYDYALMETNRGCPYRCAFCYWGGAIGQKVRKFSPERLAAEVDLIARAGYTKLSLCDANFGMLPEDERFLEACIAAKEKYGYPRYFFTSWAKNKSDAFHRVLRRMKEARLTSTFNVALQTLAPTSLELMRRKNMRLNQWEPLVEQLKEEGLDLYAELIWGTPGDDKQSFFASYDRLAQSVPQIAVYPLLIMPNTDYERRKKELGLVTFRSDGHDFELVLSHPTMSAEDNREMHRFLFWARLLGEQAYFRHVWAPARELAGLTQSALILSLDRWFDGSRHEVSDALRKLRDAVVARLETDEELLDQALRVLYRESAIDELLLQWWRQDVEALIPPEHRDFLLDVFRFDLVTRPRYRKVSLEPSPAGVEDAKAVQRYSREIIRGVPFAHDVAGVLERGALHKDRPVPRKDTRYDVTFLFLFEKNARLFYEARNKMYFGRVRPSSPPARHADASAAEQLET